MDPSMVSNHSDYYTVTITLFLVPYQRNDTAQAFVILGTLSRAHCVIVRPFLGTLS